MDREYRVKGKIIEKDKPGEGLEVKVYDEKGVFITSDLTDKEGKIDFKCGIEPKYIKVAHKGNIVHTAKLVPTADDIYAIGDCLLVLHWPPADWHIKGIVRDKMSGDPLQGLTVEAYDVDEETITTFLETLGEDVTDAAGEFNIWFDREALSREGTTFDEINPDILIKVKNVQGIVIHETQIDSEVTGTSHTCPGFTIHKGKEYIIDIDYVTAVINKIGPVSTTDIDALGRASWEGETDRPFRGNTTIGGRIWGARVMRWRLSYDTGFIDTEDTRFDGLLPSDADPFNTLIEGEDRVWDGPITTWATASLEGTHTVILVVWDDDNNEYHDTQIISLHNTVITPPAQISLPTPCDTIDKREGTEIQIRGTASDDFFSSYALRWAGCGQTELTVRLISYPPAGNSTPVVDGILGTWAIGELDEGPYVIRLEVTDRTIFNDGGRPWRDWTWNTVTIVSG